MHQGGLQWCAVFIADFGLFLHHISSDSNPGLTLKEPSRLRDRDVLCSCLYQSKEKINKKPDFGRSYRHLSFSKQPMKTGHLNLLINKIKYRFSLKKNYSINIWFVWNHLFLLNSKMRYHSHESFWVNISVFIAFLIAVASENTGWNLVVKTIKMEILA